MNNFLFFIAYYLFFVIYAFIFFVIYFFVYIIVIGLDRYPSVVSGG